MCRFRQLLYGERLTGKERRAQWKAKSGTSGVVRVHVYHAWVARMMRALSNSEEAREQFNVDGEQVGWDGGRGRSLW